MSKDFKQGRSKAHGFVGTRLYRIWGNMLCRCQENKSHSDGYGNRGITVCEDWKDFLTFKAWADTHGYADNLSIDRVDVNGNYNPENCRWCTQTEQIRNRRNTLKVVCDGEEKPLAEVCETLGIPYQRTYQRLYRYNLTLEKALSN